MPKKGVVQALEKLRDEVHKLSVRLVDEYIIEDYKKGQISDEELAKFLDKLEKDMQKTFEKMKKRL